MRNSDWLHRLYHLGTAFVAAVMVSSCSVDDTLEGTLGQDGDQLILDISYPTSTDRITFQSSASMRVEGSCRGVGREIRVWAVGVIQDVVVCSSDQTFQASLDFKTPEIPDGTVTIFADYVDTPGSVNFQEAVSLQLQAQPFIFIDPVSVSENSNLVFNVSLSHAWDEPVIFDWSTVDGSAESASSDYTASLANQVSIAVSLTSAAVTVQVNDDGLYENDETVLLTLSNAQSSYFHQSVAVGTINDNDSPPNIFIFDSAGVEGSTIAFTVSIDAVSGVDARFSYTSINGTAIGAADFMAVASNGVIPAGSTTTGISVALFDDVALELDETFEVSLVSVTDTNVITPGTDDVATGTITNSVVNPGLFITDAGPVNEGQTLEFVVSLSYAAAADVTFDWQTFDGTAKEAMAGHANGDYIPVTTMEATIPAGDLAITLSVDSLSDDFVELVDTFTVSLSNSSVNATISDAVGLGRINDVDTLPANPRWASVHPNGGQMYVTEDFSVYYFIEPGRFTASSLSQEFGYCNGSWLIPTTSGTILHSSDLLNWSEVDVGAQVTDYDGAGVKAVSCLDNRWFIFNDSSPDTIVYSDNLTTWNQSNISGTLRFQKDFHYHEGKVFLSGNNGDQLISTDFGANFTELNGVNSGLDSTSSAAADGLVFALNNPNDGVRYTDDSFVTVSQFTLVPGGVSRESAWSDYLDGRFISVFRNNSNPHVAYTEDFATMNTVSTPLTLGTAEFGDGSIVALSFDGRHPYLSDNRGTSFSAETTLPVDNWTIPARLTYGHPAVEPVLFSFPDSLNVPLNQIIESAEVTISGISLPLGVYAGNDAEVSIVGSGSWVDGWGAATVTNGDSFIIRMNSPTTAETKKTSTVRVGTRKTDWFTTTGEQVELFVTDSATVNEGQTAQFVISLSSVAASDVGFDWRTYDGTAYEVENGSSSSDYAAVTVIQRLTIPAGQTAVTIGIEAFNDDFVDFTESFEVSVSNASGISIADGVGVGTINDLDAHNPSPTLASFIEGPDVKTLYVKGAGAGADGTYYDLSKLGSINGNSNLTYCAGAWFVAALGSAVLYRSEDLTNWTSVTVTGGSNNRGTDCVDGVLFVRQNSVNLPRSDDGGLSFTTIVGDLARVDRFVGYRGKVWTGRIDTLYSSDDKGLSFSAIAGITLSENSDVFGHNDYLYVVSRVGDPSYRLFQGDPTQVEVFTITGGGVDATDLFVIDDRVFVNFSQNFGYYTDDQGASWISTSADLARGSYGNGVVYSNRNTVFQYTDDFVNENLIGNLTVDGNSTGNKMEYGSPLVDPDSFTIPTINEVALSNQIESAMITISGLSIPQGFYAGNGTEVRINGGAYVNGWGGATISNGDSFQLRMTSASTLDTEKTSSVYVGVHKTEWTVRTFENLLYVGDASAVSEGGTLEYTISLAQPAASDVTFDWQTMDGTALSTVPRQVSGDYTAVAAQSLTIGVGNSAVTVTVETLDDEFVEPQQTVLVSLSNASAGVGFADGLGSGPINDTDSLPARPMWSVVFDWGEAMVVTEDLVNFKWLELGPHASQGSITSKAAFCNGTWTVATDGGSIIYSQDLINWTEVDVATQVAVPFTEFTVFSCFNNRVIGFAEGGTGNIYSDDFDNWSESTGTTANLRFSREYVFYRGEVWGAGVNGGLAVSSDLGESFVNFSVPDSDLSDDFFDVLASDDQMVLITRGHGRSRITADRFVTQSSFTISNGGGPTNNITASGLLLDGRLVVPFSAGRFYSDDFTNFTLSPNSGRDSAQWGDGEIVTMSKSNHKVFQSTDRGQTFSEIADLSGGGNSGHKVVYGHSSVEPDIIAFSDSLSVPLNTQIESEAITISGISVPLGVYAGNGAEVSVSGGGGWLAGWGAATVSNNDSVQLRMTTASAGGTKKSTTVRIGTRKVEWTTETLTPTEVFVADAIVTEGGTASVVVSLSAADASDVTFDYKTIIGTANRFDFEEVEPSGSAEILAGDTAVTISIKTTDDTLFESDETFMLSIFNVAGGVQIGGFVGEVTIADNDPVAPAGRDVFISDVIANEGGEMTYTIYLDQPASDNFTLNYESMVGTSQSSDFVDVSGTVSFDQGSQAQQVSVQTVQDTDIENDETVFLSISGSNTLLSIIDDIGVGTILDDDTTTPSLVVYDAFADEGDALNFVVSINRTSGSDVNFTWSIVDGTATSTSDYPSTPAQAGVITSGASEVTLSVSTSEDAIAEGSEYLTVNLSAITGASATDIVGVGVINDDDAVIITTISASDAFTSEGMPLEFELNLTSSSTSDVVVSYVLLDGTASVGHDYEDVSGFHTIPAGKTSSRVFVNTVYDLLDEEAESMSLSIDSVSAAVIGDGVAVGTIENTPALMLTYPDKTDRPVGYKLKVEGGCDSAGSDVAVSVDDTVTTVTLASSCVDNQFDGYVDTTSMTLGELSIEVVQQTESGLSVTLTESAQKTTTACDVLGDRQNMVGSGYAGGTGALADPYVICTSDQLNDLRNVGAENSFLIASDIYFESGDTDGDFDDDGSDADYVSGQGWEPIPSLDALQFNGGNFMISGLRIDRGNTDQIGLFAVLSSQNTIMDLHLRKAEVTGRAEVGAVAGYLNQNGWATFSNVSCMDCRVRGSGDSVGMIMGSLSKGLNFEVRATGSVISSSSSLYVGGLVGGSNEASGLNYFYYSSFEGEVTGGEAVGGIVGRSDDTGIYQSQVDASVNGTNYVGGIGGDVSQGGVYFSVAEGEINASSGEAGCLAGRARDIEDSIALCDSVTGDASGNGVSPFSGNDITVDDVRNYYSSELVCSNNGAGGCSFADGTSVASDALLYSSTHPAYDTWDFFGDSTDGKSERWVAQADRAPRLYYSDQSWTYTSPLSGSGSMADPYIVDSADDLTEISDNPHYTTAVISMSASVNVSSESLFKGLFPYGGFRGSFDGGGYSVSGVSIVADNYWRDIGLFGHMIASANVEDLHIDIVTMSAQEGNVGGVVGYMTGDSTVSRVRVSGGMISNTSLLTTHTTYLGGVAGLVFGGASITEAEVSSAISGDRAGGIAGYLLGAGGSQTVKVSDCLSTGNISALDQSGGIVSYNRFGSDIERCYASGAVSSSSGSAGGLVGRNSSNLSDSFSVGSVTGDVDGVDDVGPLIGLVGGSTSRLYYFTGASCTNSGTGNCNSDGTGQSSLSYFYSSLNDPMTDTMTSSPVWDFTTIWQDNSGTSALPTLRNVP